MRNPKLQRSQFDQTLATNSWMLQENKKTVIHSDGLVTTASIWGRMFGIRKSEKEISKTTYNLLKRAAKYAEIDDYSADLDIEITEHDKDEFQLAPVLFSDD